MGLPLAGLCLVIGVVAALSGTAVTWGTGAVPWANETTAVKIEVVGLLFNDMIRKVQNGQAQPIDLANVVHYAGFSPVPAQVFVDLTRWAQQVTTKLANHRSTIDLLERLVPIVETLANSSGIINDSIQKVVEVTREQLEQVNARMDRLQQFVEASVGNGGRDTAEPMQPPPMQPPPMQPPPMQPPPMQPPPMQPPPMQPPPMQMAPPPVPGPPPTQIATPPVAGPRPVPKFPDYDDDDDDDDDNTMDPPLAVRWRGPRRLGG